MTANAGWTPASRPGIVPLHPLGFGTILGRSFTALRQNPRVLLGFALVVQTVAYLVTIAVIGVVAVATFSRLDTVTYGSDDWNTLFWGSIAIVGITAFLLGIPAAGVVVLVQAVVVAEVAAEVVAEKQTLREVWRRVKPAAWRVIGWAFLAQAAVVVALTVAAVVVIAIGFVAVPLGIILGILLGLGAIPLYWWLFTKLLLVPAVLILEGARVVAAVRRSWHLTRGRFWAAFGAIALIGLIFGAIAQTVSIPLSFGASFLTTIVAPTGEPNVSQIIGLLLTSVGVQVIVLLVQSVGSIVQSTATALIYVDCRMRHEGLDLDLQAYVEQRDAGSTALADPYLEHIGREVAPRPTPVFAGAPGYGMPAGYAAPAGYGAPAGSEGYQQAGYPRYPGGTSATGGYPAAYPAGAYPAAGYPTGASPIGGYPATGYPGGAYQAGAYPATAYPAAAYPGSGSPAGAYPAAGYPAGAYPGAGSPAPAAPAGYPAYAAPAASPPYASAPDASVAAPPAPWSPAVARPAETSWAAPGSDGEDGRRKDDPWG